MKDQKLETQQHKLQDSMVNAVRFCGEKFELYTEMPCHIGSDAVTQFSEANLQE
jgi:hypothetical protein